MRQRESKAKTRSVNKQRRECDAKEDEVGIIGSFAVQGWQILWTHWKSYSVKVV